jgi:hypothetical protein
MTRVIGVEREKNEPDFVAPPLAAAGSAAGATNSFAFASPRPADEEGGSGSGIVWGGSPVK